MDFMKLTRVRNREGQQSYDFYEKHYKPLSREQELVEWRKAYDGDSQAIQNLIMGSIPIINKLARKYYQYYPVDDAIQEGIIGFIRAIKTFNPEYGIRFYSYAMMRVYAHIRQAVIVYYNIRDFRDRNVTLSGDTISKYRVFSADTVAKSSGEDETPLVETLIDERIKFEDDVDDSILLKQFFDLVEEHCIEIEVKFIKERAKNRSMQSIANDHGISKQRVSQVINRGIERISTKIKRYLTV